MRKAMSRKKKIILLSAAAVLLTAILVGSVIAYFAAKEDKPNLVTVGEDDISVAEEFTPPAQSDEFSYRKLVKIDNTGTVPCYVRVRLEFSDSSVQQFASFSSENQGEKDPTPTDDKFKKAFIPDNTSDKSYYVNDLPDGWVYVWDGNASSYNNPAVTNGYYYYTKPVKPGESTDALLSWVKMNYATTADIKAHDIFVYAESVQTVNANTGNDYSAENGDGWQQAWHDFVGES